MNSTKLKLLLITFPVDYGSRTTAQNLIGVFKDRLDLKHFAFTGGDAELFEINGVNKRKNILNRIRSIPKLWKAIREARSDGRKILFHHISPALFSFPFLSQQDCFITSEWNRKLLEPLKKNKISPGWLTTIHRLVLLRVQCVLAMTEASRFAYLYGYRLPIQKVKRGKKPFNLESFHASTHRGDGITRILFVGNDFKRKGGDVLLQWFLDLSPANVSLTLATNGNVPDFIHPSVQVERGIKSGTQKQYDLFARHDLFVFPTLSDAIPMAVGEAAASGLAICTTQFGMAASDFVKNGWNGYVEENQTKVLQRTECLLKDVVSIRRMKQNSRQFMTENYHSDAVFESFRRPIFAPNEL